MLYLAPRNESSRGFVLEAEVLRNFVYTHSTGSGPVRVSHLSKRLLFWNEGMVDYRLRELF